MTFDVTKFVSLGKKIVGAGLNYNSMLKARGLKKPERPVVFLKPTSSYILQGQKIHIPKAFEVHHEVELGIIIGKTCSKISSDKIKKYIGGYCLALDLTAVDQMAKARSEGLPWTLGKGFDTSCPVGPGLICEDLPNPNDARLWCSVNGQMKQDCTTADMIFPPNELISWISYYITLEPYDLILTGSPAGTGLISPGDTLLCGLGNNHEINFHVSKN